MFNIDVKDFDILMCYGYTSTIPTNSRFLNVSNINNDSDNALYDKWVEIYNDIIETATNLAGKHYQQQFAANKTVYKLRHKTSGAIIFIGRFDSNVFAGYDVQQHFGRTYDFETQALSEYKAEEHYF